MPTDPRTDALAAACDAVFPLDAPTLVGLEATPDGLVPIEPSGFGEPEDLVGFLAPAHWDGLALVVSGRRHHLDRPTRPAAAARVTFALDRSGSWASTITTLDGTSRTGGSAGPPTGHLADCCHRALHLPAAAEPSGPGELVHAAWLIDVLDAHAELGPCFPLEDWDALVSLHPWGLSRDPVWTWATIHAALVDTGEGWGGFDHREVAWMDPPTFARFALAEVPPLRGLLAHLDGLTSPEVMQRVHLLVTGLEQHAGNVRGDPPGGV